MDFPFLQRPVTKWVFSKWDLQRTLAKYVTFLLHAFFSFLVVRQQKKYHRSPDKSDISSAEHTSLNLKLVKLSEEEEKNHKEYLERMKEETGIDPLGLT